MEARRENRRKKILDRSEDRMKFITGQRIALKERETTDLSKNSAKNQDDNESSGSVEMAEAMKNRVNPALRRRQAAKRRNKEKEAEKAKDSTETSSKNKARNEVTEIAAETQHLDSMKKESPPDFSFETKGVQSKDINRARATMRLICLFLQCMMGISLSYASIKSEYLMPVITGRTADPRYAPYFDLIDRGIPIESVREQAIREHLDIALLERSNENPYGVSMARINGESIRSSNSFFNQLWSFTTPSLFWIVLVFNMIIKPLVSMVVCKIYEVSTAEISDEEGNPKGIIYSVIGQVIGQRSMNILIKCKKLLEDFGIILFSLILSAGFASFLIILLKPYFLSN